MAWPADAFVRGNDKEAGMKLRLLTVSTLVAALALTPGFGVSAADKTDKKFEREEKAVPLDQVPPAVKATIDKEAKGGTPVAVMMETEKGKTFYEVEISKNNKAQYIHIAQDGKVLKREHAKTEAKEERKEEGKK
jgi:uncharacterized membrane protein YkoI